MADELTPELPTDGAEVLDPDDLLTAITKQDRTGAGLRKSAEHTGESIRHTETRVAAVIRTIPGLDAVIAELQQDETLSRMDEPVDWQDVADNETYAGIIQELLIIVDRYREGEIDFATSQEDVLKLGAGLIYLSQKLGVFQAQVSDMKSKVEKLRTVAYVKSKGMGTSKRAKVSDSDAKEIAKYFSIDATQKLTALEGIERYLYNMFMSFRTFQEMLNFVAGREAKVNFGPSLP